MVVHPRADAGVVSRSVKEAKAVAARMSFFMINTPLCGSSSSRCGGPVTVTAQWPYAGSGDVLAITISAVSAGQSC
jgi:hypothetical protein